MDASCAGLADVEAEAFVITGDIGEAPNVSLFLNTLDTYLQGARAG